MLKQPELSALLALASTVRALEAAGRYALPRSGPGGTLKPDYKLLDETEDSGFHQSELKKYSR
jgi:hypothetical protein